MSWRWFKVYFRSNFALDASDDGLVQVLGFGNGTVCTATDLVSGVDSCDVKNVCNLSVSDFGAVNQ
jgi:hypothetical protein